MADRRRFPSLSALKKEVEESSAVRAPPPRKSPDISSSFDSDLDMDDLLAPRGGRPSGPKSPSLCPEPARTNDPATGFRSYLREKAQEADSNPPAPATSRVRVPHQHGGAASMGNGSEAEPNANAHGYAYGSSQRAPFGAPPSAVRGLGAALEEQGGGMYQLEGAVQLSVRRQGGMGGVQPQQGTLYREPTLALPYPSGDLRPPYDPPPHPHPPQHPLYPVYTQHYARAAEAAGFGPVPSPFQPQLAPTELVYQNPAYGAREEPQASAAGGASQPYGYSYGPIGQVGPPVAPPGGAATWDPLRHLYPSAPPAAAAPGSGAQGGGSLYSGASASGLSGPSVLSLSSSTPSNGSGATGQALLAHVVPTAPPPPASEPTAPQLADLTNSQNSTLDVAAASRDLVPSGAAQAAARKASEAGTAKSAQKKSKSPDREPSSGGGGRSTAARAAARAARPSSGLGPDLSRGTLSSPLPPPRPSTASAYRAPPPSAPPPPHPAPAPRPSTAAAAGFSGPHKPTRREYEEALSSYRLRVKGLQGAVHALEAEVRTLREQQGTRDAGKKDMADRTRYLEMEVHRMRASEDERCRLLEEASLRAADATAGRESLLLRIRDLEAARDVAVSQLQSQLRAREDRCFALEAQNEALRLRLEGTEGERDRLRGEADDHVLRAARVRDELRLAVSDRDRARLELSRLRDELDRRGLVAPPARDWAAAQREWAAQASQGQGVAQAVVARAPAEHAARPAPPPPAPPIEEEGEEGDSMEDGSLAGEEGVGPGAASHSLDLSDDGRSEPPQPPAMVQVQPGPSLAIQRPSDAGRSSRAASQSLALVAPAAAAASHPDPLRPLIQLAPRPAPEPPVAQPIQIRTASPVESRPSTAAASVPVPASSAESRASGDQTRAPPPAVPTHPPRSAPRDRPALAPAPSAPTPAPESPPMPTSTDFGAHLSAAVAKAKDMIRSAAAVSVSQAHSSTAGDLSLRSSVDAQGGVGDTSAVSAGRGQHGERNGGPSEETGSSQVSVLGSRPIKPAATSHPSAPPSRPHLEDSEMDREKAVTLESLARVKEYIAGLADGLSRKDPGLGLSDLDLTAVSAAGNHQNYRSGVSASASRAASRTASPARPPFQAPPPSLPLPPAAPGSESAARSDASSSLVESALGRATAKIAVEWRLPVATPSTTTAADGDAGDALSDTSESPRVPGTRLSAALGKLRRRLQNGSRGGSGAGSSGVVAPVESEAESASPVPAQAQARRPAPAPIHRSPAKASAPSSADLRGQPFPLPQPSSKPPAAPPARSRLDLGPPLQPPWPRSAIADSLDASINHLEASKRSPPRLAVAPEIYGGAKPLPSATSTSPLRAGRGSAAESAPGLSSLGAGFGMPPRPAARSLESDLLDIVADLKVHEGASAATSGAVDDDPLFANIDRLLAAASGAGGAGVAASRAAGDRSASYAADPSLALSDSDAESSDSYVMDMDTSRMKDVASVGRLEPEPAVAEPATERPIGGKSQASISRIANLLAGIDQILK